jgi:glycine cleavage system aminomethyltransferase T
VPVTPEGYVIGDVILFYLAENEFSLVGRAPAIEWVEFHAQYGRDGSKWNVTVERDERTALRTDGKRKNYRFQLQGPNAMKILGRRWARPRRTSSSSTWRTSTSAVRT